MSRERIDVPAAAPKTTRPHGLALIACLGLVTGCGSVQRHLIFQKAIPVPEDWVPVGARNWAPQRKYWAAAATCHLPIYFQDPVLERYGHPVEQFVGPVGRYLSYPVDDPNQSTQRNQIIQPFFSAGLFALQAEGYRTALTEAS